jgi:hypothetical protein
MRTFLAFSETVTSGAHRPILPRIHPERSCSLAGNVHQSNDLVTTYPTIVAKTREIRNLNAHMKERGRVVEKTRSG